MVRAFVVCTVVCAACNLALAQQGGGVPSIPSPDATHWAITVVGTFLAAWWASDAFNRPFLLIADQPTFPRYMTGRGQYLLGRLIFVIFACSFFLLLIRFHSEVVDALTDLGIPIPDKIVKAVKEQSTSYLVMIIAMGSIYLYLLTKEAEWNVLLKMRDVIQRWISIPQLAGGIVAQIRLSLCVPEEAIASVIVESKGLAEQDFRKDSNTPDRIWAETCYMRWWLAKGNQSGEDATFFSSESFGYFKLLEEFQRVSSDLVKWKSNSSVVDLEIIDLPQRIKDIYKKISRLVACYVIYRNGSRKELSEAAHKFGINLSFSEPDNSLRYWILYAAVLMVSVYIGVYASAICYDLFLGKGFNLVQDPNRALAWMNYALSNYGLAILAILLLRSVFLLLRMDAQQSHLITYCWTFIVAFFAGPFGLTLAVHFFGQGKYPEIPITELYFLMLRWGLGPALVSVYISYYLDRQTFQDLPDIDHSSKTLFWRLTNCIGFAAVNLFLLIPQLLSLNAQQNAVWETPKLRFVASGSTFCVALGLALAAQFALRKGQTNEQASFVLNSPANAKGTKAA